MRISLFVIQLKDDTLAQVQVALNEHIPSINGLKQGLIKPSANLDIDAYSATRLNLIATLDGLPVAFAALDFEDKDTIGYITVFVKEEVRCNGIGSGMLDCLFKIAREKHLQQLVTIVDNRCKIPLQFPFKCPRAYYDI